MAFDIDGAQMTMDSRIQPAMSPGPSLLERVGRGPLVGRGRELAEAAVDLRHALAGEGRVLLISGEPGVGKTRLAREIMAQMQAAGGTALSGECYAEGDVPYAPVARLIRESFPEAARLDLSDTVVADLIALVPPLVSHYPAIPPPNPGLDPRPQQQRLFESVVAWCEAMSAGAPLLLFVDDVQWADSATLFLLRHLARRGQKLRLLLLMTFRASELERSSSLSDVLLDFNRERLATHLRLGRLGRDETRDLLAALFSEEITPEFLDGIYAQTEGNPFFTEEVCKELIEEGKLAYRDGRWHRPSMSELKIPQTVRAAIQARVGRVSQPAQEALRLAAILGREFDFETLQRAGDLDEETLIAALESALRAQLISEVESGEVAAQRFSFVHVLISTTLRESTIHVRRRALHRRAAQALEAIRPGDFEALAYHYAGAGEAERAREYAVQAGDRAQTWAPEDAARLYRAALKHWPDADAQGRAETLGKLGYCLWVKADDAGALACYETAYRLFDRLGQRLQSGETQRMIGQVYWELADREAALRHHHQALQILEQGPETVELARAISSISRLHALASEHDEAVAWGERALAMAERLGAENVIVDALTNIGISYGESGTWEKALDLLQESVQRAVAWGLPAEACRAYNNLVEKLQAQCRYASAIEWLDQMYAYATRAYSTTFMTLARFWQMVVNWDMGRWSAALAYRNQITELSTLMVGTWVRRRFAAMDLDLGRTDEGWRELEETLPNALRANDLQTTAAHLGQLVRVYEATGQAARAAEAIGSILERLGRRLYPRADCIMPLYFACHWLAGQTAAVRSEQGSACLSHLERLDGALGTGECRAALAEARACLWLAEGRTHAATERFRQAAAGWETIGRRYDQARALASLGRALAVAGEPTGARAACGQARDIVESLAAQLDEGLRASFLASPLVQEICQATDPPFKASRSGTSGRELAGLTEREIEVLRLVAQGLTNAEIAAILVVSPLTVNAHMRSIFNKLDVTRRAAAARFAVEHGLV
jgi:DNA-binding CsgD family transcriptional regulator/RecA/RadA recombinase